MAEPAITSGGRERVPAASAVLSKAFETDPVLTYMLCTMSTEDRIAYLHSYFRTLLTAAALNHAEFAEADDWKCCGVLVPPGCRVDNMWTILQAGFIPMLWKIGIGGCQRMLSEYTPLSDACKAKGLKGQKNYYYVFFIATREDCRRKGLCSKIVRYWQEKTKEDGVPIWLEATTENSMKLYERLGFEVVGDFLLGKGMVKKDAVECKGGEGVKAWGMLWWPEETKQG